MNYYARFSGSMVRLTAIDIIGYRYTMRLSGNFTPPEV